MSSVQLSSDAAHILLDNTFAGIYISQDSELVYVNPAFLKITGYSIEEVLGRDPTTLVHPEDSSRVQDIARNIIKKDVSTDYEYQIITRSGETKWVRETVGRINCKGKRAVAGYLVDISQERGFREREQRLLSNIWLGILRSTPAGRFVFVNEAFCNITGYSAEELYKMNIAQLYVESADRDRFVSEMTSEQGNVTREIHWKRKDGEEFLAMVRLTVDRDSRGDVKHYDSIVEDITEFRRIEAAEKARQKELEETLARLEWANRELKHFAYVTSHDLQEPLRMVSSFTQLLAKKYHGQLDEDADEFIGYAVEGAERMQRLLNDLLVYSRVTTRGKEFEPTDVEDALHQARANLKLAIDERDAEITQEPLPTVIGDSTQLVQLFQNLIANAIKFCKDSKPEIHISAKHDGDSWVFSVRDNGIGIDPQYFDRIFIIFQRLHGRTEYPGTGAGLAICKNIVERHHGRIWVESEEGKGATFYFTIPTRQKD